MTEPSFDLAARLGALLFVSGDPVEGVRLLELLGCDEATLDAAFETLRGRCRGLGLVLVEHAGAYQLATAPALAEHVEAFLGVDRPARLSAAALETLAIVAYRQPVTRAEIEAIRGVDSSAALQTLVARGLIEPVGRLPTAGQPIQYGTTPQFLQAFGLASLEELPELPPEIQAALWRAGDLAGPGSG